MTHALHHLSTFLCLSLYLGQLLGKEVMCKETSIMVIKHMTFQPNTHDPIKEIGKMVVTEYILLVKFSPTPGQCPPVPKNHKSKG
jgi:hypothetical protein